MTSPEQTYTLPEQLNLTPQLPGGTYDVCSKWRELCSSISEPELRVFDNGFRIGITAHVKRRVKINQWDTEMFGYNFIRNPNDERISLRFSVGDLQVDVIWETNGVVKIKPIVVT